MPFPSIPEPLRAQLTALAVSPHPFAAALSMLAIVSTLGLEGEEIGGDLFDTVEGYWMGALDDEVVCPSGDAADLIRQMPGVDFYAFADWAMSAGLPASAPEVAPASAPAVAPASAPEVAPA